MLPPRFQFHQPASLDEALSLLAEHGEEASPFAGGTELLIALKARVLRFEHLIDIKRIPDLAGIAIGAAGSVSIGSLVTHEELTRSAIVRERMPGYAALSDNIANIRVRKKGTLGGNLCFAEPHADPPALLCAFGTRLHLASPRGRRDLTLHEFIESELSTARESDELLVRIEVPALPQGARGGYRAFGHLERPALGVGAVAIPSGDGFDWRIFAAGLCGRPTELLRTQDAMRGLPATDALEVLSRHADEDAADIEAHDDLQGSADYKRHMVAVLARRACRIALGYPERAGRETGQDIIGADRNA